MDALELLKNTLGTKLFRFQPTHIKGTAASTTCPRRKENTSTRLLLACPWLAVYEYLNSLGFFVVCMKEEEEEEEEEEVEEEEEEQEEE